MSNQTPVYKTIASLPIRRKLAYESARIGRESGITSEQLNAEYTLIDSVLQMLIELAAHYPPNHFGEPNFYFHSLARSFCDWHLRCLEFGGTGSGGTLVRVIAAALTVNDLERLVTEIVRSTAVDIREIDYDSWLTDWEAA
jgi:hypothetical protein